MLQFVDWFNLLGNVDSVLDLKEVLKGEFKAKQNFWESVTIIDVILAFPI